MKNWQLWLSGAAAAKSLQSCPTLCDPIDSSPPGSPIPGILQARTLEGVAISFSNARKWKVKVKSLSCVRLLATPWIAAYQAPPSMGFSRQEHWSGVPLPSPWLSKDMHFRKPFQIVIFQCSTSALNFESESRSVVPDSLWPHGPYSPWNSPGQNTGVSRLSFLQGIFPTQGSKPDLPHCSWILY